MKCNHWQQLKAQVVCYLFFSIELHAMWLLKGVSTLLGLCLFQEVNCILTASYVDYSLIASMLYGCDNNSECLA